MQFTLLIYTFVSTYLIVSTSHESLEITEISNMRPVYCITSQKYHNQDSSNLTECVKQTLACSNRVCERQSYIPRNIY